MTDIEIILRDFLNVLIPESGTAALRLRACIPDTDNQHNVETRDKIIGKMEELISYIKNINQYTQSDLEHMTDHELIEISCVLKVEFKDEFYDSEYRLIRGNLITEILRKQEEAQV